MRAVNPSPGSASPAHRARAAVAHGAGDLRLEEVDVPEPSAGQVAVRIAYGGICGSDLHYYHRGGVGDFMITEPLVLGHEVVGTVLASGDQTSAPEVGTPVAVHPATPCGHCLECRAGRRTVCRDSRYLGSAAHTPHVQGGFADVLLVPAPAVLALPVGLPLQRAALAEPLAVALHAVRRAGDVTGARVLVTGAGPIGVLVVAALTAAGAAEVIVTDLVDEALAVATSAGATSTARADALTPSSPPLDVDVAIEASGAPAGLATCLQQVRRGGAVVQLGLLPPGTVPFAGNSLVTHEVDLRGSFRFDTEIHDALSLLAGDLPVHDVVSHVLPLSRLHEAFEIAGDRHAACKVLLDFTE